MEKCIDIQARKLNMLAYKTDRLGGAGNDQGEREKVNYSPNYYDTELIFQSG